MKENELQALIDKNNAEYGTQFSLGGTYGNHDLWVNDDQGDHRLEAGSVQDCYEAFIKNRFKEKYTKKEGTKKTAWTEDYSDATPGALMVMDIDRSVWEKNGWRDRSNVDTDVLAEALKPVADKVTQEDIDVLEDYNFHAAVEVIMNIQKTATGGKKTASFDKINEEPMTATDAQAFISQLKEKGIESAVNTKSENEVDVYVDSAKKNEAEELFFVGGLLGRNATVDKTADADKKYTAQELDDMPTLEEEHTDNLKVETPDTRVWLSKMTVADGMPYDNAVIIEKLQNGNWITTDTYDGGAVSKGVGSESMSDEELNKFLGEGK